jgi:serine/threonine protein kinase
MYSFSYMYIYNWKCVFCHFIHTFLFTSIIPFLLLSLTLSFSLYLPFSLYCVSTKVIEHCSGGDLASYYKTQQFSTLEFCRVVTEMLSGIEYLHSSNIKGEYLCVSTILCIFAFLLFSLFQYNMHLCLNISFY